MWPICAEPGLGKHAPSCVLACVCVCVCVCVCRLERNPVFYQAHKVTLLSCVMWIADPACDSAAQSTQVGVPSRWLGAKGRGGHSESKGAYVMHVSV
jgi:hypothetical protein